MAQSYADPTKQCFGPSHNPDTPEGWKNFCDCMFLGARVRVDVLVDGRSLYIPGLDTQNLTEAQSNELVKLAVQAQLAKTPKANIRYIETLEPVKTENWYRCTSLVCAIPGAGSNYGRPGAGIGGCANPYTGAVDPFNIGVGMPFAPWTDLGAAARGIPKEGAGFGYTFTQLVSIDLADYTPLRLWQIYFQNPALFTLQVAKVSVLAPAAVPLMGLFLNFPVGAATLAPLALAQCAAEGKNVMQAMMLPALKGATSFAFVAFKSIGSFLGGQWFSMAGALVGKAAQDQIDTGEIGRVGDPFTRSVIVFLSKNAARLGDEIQTAVNGGWNLESAPRVVDFIADMMEDLASEFKDDQVAYNGILLTTKAMRVASIIAEGVKQKTPAFRIVDQIIDKLFGFKVSELTAAVEAGPAAVKKLVATAQSVSGTPIDVVMQVLKMIETSFNDFTKVISDINTTFGGAVDGLVKQFDAAKTMFAGVARETQAPLQKAMDAAGISQTPQTPQTTTQMPHAAVPVASRSSSLAAAAVGGGIGFISAGPLGGVLGVIAGYGLVAANMQPKLISGAVAKRVQDVTSAPLQTTSEAAVPDIFNVAALRASYAGYGAGDIPFDPVAEPGAPVPLKQKLVALAPPPPPPLPEATFPMPEKQKLVALAPPPPLPSSLVASASAEATRLKLPIDPAVSARAAETPKEAPQEMRQRRGDYARQGQAAIAAAIAAEQAAAEARAKAAQEAAQEAARAEAARAEAARAQQQQEIDRLKRALATQPVYKPPSGGLPSAGPTYIYPEPAQAVQAESPVRSATRATPTHVGGGVAILALGAAVAVFLARK